MVGDIIYVINDKRNVVVGQEITSISEEPVTVDVINKLTLNPKSKRVVS